MYTQEDIENLKKEWETNPRWKGIERLYSAEDVIKLQGSLQIDYPLARIGSEKLWQMFQTEPSVRALGALSGNQAVQMVQAGLKAIYASGWQVAADANDGAQTYPDQSLYPYLSMPHLINRLNNALSRADQIQHMHNEKQIDWFVPIVADAEAGFGGPLNAFELIKAMIEAGAAAVHLEDQLSSLKKCGHMGGKVLVPGNIFISKLMAARLAADVMGIPLIIIARTDAYSAKMIRSDFDHIDQPFLTGERSPDGYYFLKGGVPYAIARALDFAPYSDLIWCETSTPDLGEAREFAEGVHEKFPGKWLAYNCSPSFNWKANLDEKSIRHFQDKLAEMGYKFQFVTLAGFHTLNASIFDLAVHYKEEGMTAYSRFQEHEFALQEEYGFSAIKHQQFVGTEYFDKITTTLNQGQTSTTALTGSTEEQQFS
ncbi:MAG: Isocitrate lyase [Chlamydiae bacterium]|nr:Isocitrate lyase [Chlamydiota bacterium]